VIEGAHETATPESMFVILDWLLRVGFVFPVRSDGRRLEIVKDLPISPFSRTKIDATISELREEKAMVSELLAPK